MAPNKPDLLQKPLYIFDLPEEILDTLTLKSDAVPPAEADPQLPKPAPQTADAEGDSEQTSVKATSCNLCNLNFPNVQEQRDHVKSDLHRYNLKQRLKGLKPVNEIDFERLIGELDESISGSDLSDSESENNDRNDSTLTSLLKKQARISHEENDEDTFSKRPKRGAGKLPLIWMSSSSLPDNISLGVYRVLFTHQDQENPIDTIRAKQLAPIADSKGTKPDQSTLSGGTVSQKSPTYFLCMIGGGHFAAMIVSLAPKMARKHTGQTERQATVIAHKTFHRYTTRRRQGGSQSAKDAANGAAHSAGATLRRYNESALLTEVRALLGEWKSLIDEAELVFVRAAGTTNRRLLFGPYEGQVLRSNDPRNRGFPFSTRRATQAELMRAFVELTRFKVSHVDEAALAATATAAAAAARETDSALAPKPKFSPKPYEPSAEEEAAMLHTSQLTSLIRRSKVPAIISYISTNNLTLHSFAFFPRDQHYHTPTPLHLASSLGSAPVINALLTKCKADPTLRSPEGNTAAEIAKDRSARDAFRQARHTLGEKAWDWSSAGVGTALSPADAAARDAKERDLAGAEAAKESERRKAETERLRKEDLEKETATKEKKHGKGKVLGEMTGAEKREIEGRGLTDEMRARLERERRARAAEERMRRLQGGGT